MKAEEDAQKATDKQLEEIKQIGEKTGPQVWSIVFAYSSEHAANIRQVVDDLLKAVVTVNPEVPTRTEQPTV
jgi:V-type H+-transporting ATPase subunit G